MFLQLLSRRFVTTIILLVASLVVLNVCGCDSESTSEPSNSNTITGSVTTNMSAMYSLSEQRTIDLSGLDSSGFVMAASTIDIVIGYILEPQIPGGDPKPRKYRVFGSPRGRFEITGMYILTVIEPNPDYAAIMPLGFQELSSFNSVPIRPFISEFETTSRDSLVGRVFGLRAQDGSFAAFEIVSIDSVSDTLGITFSWKHQTDLTREFD